MISVSAKSPEGFASSAAAAIAGLVVAVAIPIHTMQAQTIPGRPLKLMAM
jgi:hypothetical protein